MSIIPSEIVVKISEFLDSLGGGSLCRINKHFYKCLKLINNGKILFSDVSKCLSESLFKWCFLFLNCPFNVNLTKSIARHGRLENFIILEKLFDTRRRCFADALDYVGIFTEAAVGGHTHIMEHFYSSNWKFPRSLYISAAKGGHINVIQWLNKKDITGLIKTNTFWYDIQHPDADIFEFGISSFDNDLDLEYPYQFDEHIDDCSGKLSDADDEIGIFEFEEEMCKIAAEEGHLDLLKWLIDIEGYKSNKDLCSRASKGGHLHIIQWALLNKFELTISCYIRAMIGCHIHILDWLKENNCPSGNTKLADCAACTGNFSILKWAIDSGFELTENAVMNASKFGHVNILEYLLNQHVWMLPSSSSTIIIKSTFKKYNHCSNSDKQQDKNLNNSIFKAIQEDLYLNSVTYQRKNVIEWLINNGFKMSKKLEQKLLEQWTIRPGTCDMVYDKDFIKWFKDIIKNE